jgi:NTP pyrophosphatase (non-canonical NTP hydrolase)
MALLEFDSQSRVDETKSRLSVVLCGSYRRDPEGLASVYSQLTKNFEVVSPRSLNFVDPTVDFVRLSSEIGLSDAEIETRHLAAMTSADFVWLHAPDGYVGLSASMEIGHASALGIPVFAATRPTESILADLVMLAPNPMHVTRSLLAARERPGQGLNRLQKYYEAAAVRRSWDRESVEQTIELLAGELSELRTAIRKHDEGISAEDDHDADVAGELADVQLYLVHLASALDLDLSRAVNDKERLNAGRFESKRSVA